MQPPRRLNLWSMSLPYLQPVTEFIQPLSTVTSTKKIRSAPGVRLLTLNNVVEIIGAVPHTTPQGIRLIPALCESAAKILETGFSL